MIEEVSASGKPVWLVSHFFNSEEEAKLFEEYAETAFSIWKWNTGKLNKPRCDLSIKDEEESASLKKTGHSSCA